MAEDFGDSTGSGLVNTAGQAAKEVVQAVVTKGAGIGGKGGGGISLSGEAKDMMADPNSLQAHLPHLPASIWSQSPTSPVR